MSIRNIHHVACVVPDMATGYRFWRDTIGLPVVREGESAAEGVISALLSIGNAYIELIQPTRGGTDVGSFLERTGGGLHHLCLETEDIAAETESLRQRRVPLLSPGVEQGLAGPRVFVERSATQSVLVEVAQPEHPTKIDGRLQAALFTQLTMAVTVTGNLFKSASEWETNFGLQVESYLIHPEADNRHVVISVSGTGPVYIEIIRPLTEAGKNAAYLRKAGEGMFQLAIRTGNLDEAVERLSQAGYRIQQEPGMSLVDEPATFVHPKSSGNVFITFSAADVARSGPIPREAWELRLREDFASRRSS